MPLILDKIKDMTKIPIYLLSTSQATDPLKAGVSGRSNDHWSGAPIRDEVIKLHPNLKDALITASTSTDLEPYFTTWYKEHQAELKESHDKLLIYLITNWSILLADIEEMTNTSPWDMSPIAINLSSLYPSSYWSDTHAIDLYYQTADFGRDLLHELVHLRTADLLGSDWFIEHNLIGQQKALFMELLADILLARSGNNLAQAARSPYPFFAKYNQQMKLLMRQSDFMSIASSLASEVNKQ